MNNTLLLEGERLDKVNENITLIQKKDGLTFGSDAFLLASYIKEQKSGRAAELGAGTGIISLLLAARGRFSHVRMFEIQSEFAELCERNIELNSLGARLDVRCADIRDIGVSDVEGELDAVFANPPYMRTDSGKKNRSDAKYIARHEICGTIDDFCATASRLLKYGGRFYCVWRPDRLSSLFGALARHSLEPKRMTFVCADTDTAPSMVLLSATKGGAESLELTKPLILHEKESQKAASRELTATAQKIYDTMSFESFFSQGK